MAIIKKTLFPKNLDKYSVLVIDNDPNSRYFKITELPDTFTGGKNAFLIAGSEELMGDTRIQIELKDASGNIIYHEPGEGIISSSINGESFVTEYFEGVSKVVSVYIYPDTAYGPCTLTILGELEKYEDNNGIINPIPVDWEGKYNVKWQKTINVNPSLANTTKIRFYQRPTATITEILSPIYSIVGDNKVASAVTQSFANIKLSNLETFAGDVKRVKVFRTSLGDISDYSLIQDILVEAKELMTSYGLSGSVVGNTGIFTSEVLKNQWNSGSLNATLNSTRVESGVRLTGSGYFTYTQSLDIKSTNTYELNLDAFYSSSINSNLGIYLASGSMSSSIGTLYGTQPTKNLLDTVIPFKIDTDYPTASLYFSQSQGQWHLGNISLKLSEDTAFSPDEISFITSMPTVVGNESYNFKFEFYDVNNNYVPVYVTQSATFVGGSTGSAVDVDFIISSSVSQSNDALNRVSSSISGTVTLASSSISGPIGRVSGSVSGSLYSLSGSVSGTISTLSSSVSSSNTYILSSSLSKTQQLADGKYSGSFIGDTVVYSPTIGGQQGYISGKFQVGNTNPIILDATTLTRKIYIGAGTGSNANTSVYLDSDGQFSLGTKLTWNGTNLSVNGSITITNPSTANNGGAVGSFSNGDALTAGSVGGVTIASTKIYIGTGTYGNSNTAFYVDNTGRFSLKDKLTWDGTTLSIIGNLAVGSSVPNSVVTGLGSLATKSSVSATTDVTGLGVLATRDTVAATHIDANAVTNAKIASDAVTEAKIATNAITEGKISANAVVADKISAGAIVADKIATGAITAGKISAGAIEADKIAAGAITAGKIAAGAITADKISVSDLSALNASIGGWTINASSISKTSSGKTITLNSAGSEISLTGLGTTNVRIGTQGIYTLSNSYANTTYIGDGGIMMAGSWTNGGAVPDNYISNFVYDDGINKYARLVVNNAIGTATYNAVEFYSSPASNMSTLKVTGGGIFIGSVGSGNGGYVLQGAGTATFSGDVIANTSDGRLKTNIKNIDSPLEKISKINGVYFNWNEKAKELTNKNTEIREVGFIAQEVQSVLPEIIKPAAFDVQLQSGENYLTIQYEKIVPLLVECIKELKLEIEELKKNK